MRESEPENPPRCDYCGERLLGHDSIYVQIKRIVPADLSCYLDGTQDEGDTLHRHCLGYWVEGLWIRVESRVRMLGDDP